MSYEKQKARELQRLSGDSYQRCLVTVRVVWSGHLRGTNVRELLAIVEDGTRDGVDLSCDTDFVKAFAQATDSTKEDTLVALRVLIDLSRHGELPEACEIVT